MSDHMSIPEYINISTMAKHLNISRSRLYQLIDQRVLLQPVYLLSNKRPVYTREMAVRNIEVKNSNVGINQKIVMFYSARTPTVKSKPKKIVKRSTVQKVISSDKHTDMIDALESLGLENITSSQIGTAINKCFPNGTGTGNISDDDILTSVFRHLKCRNSEHKPRT
jgi:hypothetical protein